MRREILTVVLLTCGEAAIARAGDSAALLTQGKLDADMGNSSAAAIAFEAVAEDSTAPSGLRWEALIRLGLVRRDMGDARAAAEAFQRVWRDYRQEQEAVAQLIQATGGAIPAPERWNAIWQKVVVKIDATKTDHPIMRVQWPGAPAGLRRYTGQNITLDLNDGNLQDIFRLFADITGLNVVVYPGTQGHVTLRFKDVPWDDALDRMLAPNGLAASLVGPVLEIGRPEDIEPPRRFDGKPIDVDFKDVDLQEGLRDIAERGGRELAAESPLTGRVTINLQGVPWDQAFDLVARLNGLAWKRDGTRMRVGRPKDLG
jgi:hypothetical protein